MSLIMLVMLVFLIVPILLAGIITLFIKGGSAVRWFLGIFLLLIVIGFFGLFSMRVVTTVDVPVSPHQLSAPQGATLTVNKDSVVWREGLEEELIPDAYSGTEAAAYGLGVQLQEIISALPQLPERIVIVEKDVDIALLEQLRRGLKSILPDTDIVIASEASEGQVCISLQLKNVESRQTQIPQIRNGNVVQMSQLVHTGSRGVLQAVVQTPDNKYAKQVEFDNCLWLYHQEKFQPSTVGRQWAVIASKETAVTKEQALKQVAESAQYYLMQQNGLQNIHQSDLRSHGIIVDEYTQRLQGMSGPIWRAALLLDVSPERIQKLRQNIITVNRVQRKTWAFQIFSLVGMLIVISVLYLFVNAITKGYYSTTILIVAVIAFLVFLFLFLA